MAFQIGVVAQLLCVSIAILYTTWFHSSNCPIGNSALNYDYMSPQHTLPLPGYVDEASFAQDMRNFQQFCGPERPQFLYMDGYDAHFSDVLSELKEDYIYVFFLRGQNRIGDQPNDNGQNAMFEGDYKDAREKRIREKPGVRITPADVNWCLMRAWSCLKKRRLRSRQQRMRTS